MHNIHPCHWHFRIEWNITGMGMTRLGLRYIPDKLWTRENINRWQRNVPFLIFMKTLSRNIINIFFCNPSQIPPITSFFLSGHRLFGSLGCQSILWMSPEKWRNTLSTHFLKRNNHPSSLNKHPCQTPLWSGISLWFVKSCQLPSVEINLWWLQSWETFLGLWEVGRSFDEKNNKIITVFGTITVLNLSI